MYVALLISAFVALLIQNRLSNKGSTIVFYLFELLIISLIGFRDISIGIDTYNYYSIYKHCGQLGFDYIDEITFSSELGFSLLNIVANKIGLSWSLFCILCASIYVIPIFELIRRKSENKFFSLLLFILAGYFFFPMSTVRQSIAIGICIIAYLLFDNKRLLFAVLVTLCASSFHVSAIVFFAFLLIQSIPLNHRNAMLWIIVSTVVVVSLMPVLRFLVVFVMQTLSKEYEEIETGGNLQEVFFVATFVLSFLFTKRSFIDKHSPELKAILLAAILLPVLQFHPALGRLYFYFSIFMIILIPSFLLSIKDTSQKVLGIICYITVYMMLFNTYFVPEKCLYPYKFIAFNI